MDDDDFLALLHQHNTKQFINQSTRCSTLNTSDNILDLAIAQETSTLIATVSVVVSHHLSDHHHAVCDLKLGREKIPSPSHMAWNIKAIDRPAFVRHSSLFTDPADTDDVMADLLDFIASLRTVRYHNSLPTH